MCVCWRVCIGESVCVYVDMCMCVCVCVCVFIDAYRCCVGVILLAYMHGI